MKKLSFLILLAGFFAAPSLGQTSENLLSNGDFSGDKTSWNLNAYGTQKPNFSVVDADAPEGLKKALRVEVVAEEKMQKWTVGATQTLEKPIAPGTLLKATFYARSPQSNGLAVMVETVKEPRKSPFYREFALSPNWQKFEASGAAVEGFGARETWLNFHLSLAPGTIEIAGVKVEGLVSNRADLPTREKPQSLIQNGNFAAPLDTTWDIYGQDSLQMAITDARETPAGKALQLQIAPPADAKPWDVQLGQKLNAFIGLGELVSIRFWARSPQSVSLSLVAELAVQPYEKFLSRNVKLTPQWKEYHFAALTERPYEAQGAQFKWFLGAAPGTVEIADVKVENLGRTDPKLVPETVDFWGGQANPDTWRAPALARIEKIRKGDFTVRVVDEKGRPVAGAKVKIALARHAFRFGTEGNSKWILGTDADSEKYRAVLKRNFNTFVFGNELKWPAIERDASNFKNVDAAMQWLKSNGFEVRGHNLQWGSWQYSPPFLRTASVEKAREAVEAHTSGLASRFKGQLYVWDAVNEAASETELWEKIGWQEFPRTFQLARQADPGALLCYNDFNISNESAAGTRHRETVKKRIQFLLDNRAPLDIIGDQAHMEVPLTPIKRVLEIWDEMARFGKPLEITEFDATIADETVHAQYVRDYLIAAFSHPSVKAFVMWGFWAPQHWRGENAAMFRQDWSQKPAQREYERLVLNAWWTRANGQTSKTGDWKTRGFWGDYTVEVAANGKTVKVPFKLAPNSQTCRVILR